jgi:hypothetical protein
VHQTCGGDDFIGGIAVKIQRFDRTTNIKCQRPSLNARQGSSQFWVLQIYLDVAQLGEFAISQSTIAEILQVSFDSKARSRRVKSSVKA